MLQFNWWLVIVTVTCHYLQWGSGEDYVPTSHFLNGHPNGIPNTCEPIKIELCMGVGYNETVMPNMVGHDGQSDAEALLQTFTPLIQYNCSPQLKLFLCSAYVPMCTDKVPQPIGPCRDFCQQVQKGCEPVLTEFGFVWPASLDCNLFHPENNHQNMCIPGESVTGNSHSGGTSSSSSSSSSSASNSWTNSRPGHHPSSSSSARDETGMSGGGTFSPPGLIPRFNVGGGTSTSVGSHPVETHGPVFTSSSGSGGFNSVDNCGNKVSSRGECWIRCGNVEGGLFSQHEKEHASRYAFIWALFSLVLSLIVVILATQTRSRHSPAERPILYIGVCQIFYSIGVVIGSRSTPCVLDKLTGIEFLARGSLVTSSCSLVYLLTYFFGIASALWWVSLCLSWLLSLNKNMANSLESREWSMYHLITWTTASILTCIVLLKSGVDADELTGVCGVGYQDNTHLLYFMVIPMTACLGTGLLFLLTGFCLRLRKKGLDYEFVSRIPSYQQKILTEKSKTTWNRILVISLVHLIPLLTQVGVLSYELSFRKDGGKNRPNIQLFLLKINMNLISGFTAGVWILSIHSWKSWLLKICKLKSHFNCQKHGAGGVGGDLRGGGGSTNTSFLPPRLDRDLTINPGRSLPPLPIGVCPLNDDSPSPRHHYHHHHHHRDSNYEIRTETWRRGETIV